MIHVHDFLNPPNSLFNLGISRADLWQFAANVALEKAIRVTNENCDLNDPIRNEEFQVSAINGTGKYNFLVNHHKHLIILSTENCKITVENEFKFKFGRKDCVQGSFDPSEELLTPWPWESSRHENHANAYGTGKKVVQDLEVKSIQ